MSRSHSNHANQTRGPSSCDGAPTLSCQQRDLIFASEYFFKPKGVALVRSRFGIEMRSRQLGPNLDWSQEHFVFRVLCSDGQTATVWPILHKIIQDIIVHERSKIRSSSSDSNNQGDDEDQSSCDERDIETDLIQRLETWKKQNEVHVKDCHSVMQGNWNELPKYPTRINDCKHKSVWTCADENLIWICSNQVLEELAEITSCRLEADFNHGRIFIGASTVEKCALANSKLKTIYKSWGATSGTSTHLIYSEAFTNIKVALIRFIEVKQKYFRTTLLDAFETSPLNNYSNLHDAITTRCKEFNPCTNSFESMKRPKFRPTTDKRDLDLSQRDWKGYIYCSTMSLLGSSCTEPIALCMEARPKILSEERYVKFSDTDQGVATEIGFLPPLVTPEHSSPASASPSKEIRQWADQVTAVTANPEKAITEPLEFYGEFHTSGQYFAATPSVNAPWDTYCQYSPDVTVGRAAPLSQSNKLAINVEVLSDPEPSQDTRHLTSRDPALPPSKCQGTSQPLISQSDMPKENSIAQCETCTTEAQNWNPESIDPDWNEDVEQLSKFFNNENDLLTCNPTNECPTYVLPMCQIVPGSTQSRQFGEILVGCQQSNDEVKSRIFEQTMDQKPDTKICKETLKLPANNDSLTSKHSTMETSLKIIDPLPEFRTEIKAKFLAILKNISVFRGELKVQANFGRIIIRHAGDRNPASKATNCSYDAEYLQNWLSNQSVNDAPTFRFTNVVTCIAADTHYLIDMKSESGKNLWVPEPFDFVVKYDFGLLNNKVNGYSSFTVEMNAETFATKVKSGHGLGNILVHGIRRHWDFNISSTGYEIIKNHTEEYQTIADAIRSNLRVLPNLRTPSIEFEIEKRLSENFILYGIRVHQTSHYVSLDGDSMLNITQVQDLDVTSGPGSRDDLQGFRAVLNASEEERHGVLDSWYEVSVSSVSLNEALNQNEKLELGDEASWTPQGLDRLGVAEAIYLRACEMLKQMDGVGQYNSNGIDIVSILEPPAAEPTSQTKTNQPSSISDKDFFW